MDAQAVAVGGKLQGYFELAKEEIDKVVRAEEEVLPDDAEAHYHNARSTTAPLRCRSGRAVPGRLKAHLRGREVRRARRHRQQAQISPFPAVPAQDRHRRLPALGSLGRRPRLHLHHHQPPTRAISILKHKRIYEEQRNMLNDAQQTMSAMKATNKEMSSRG